MRVNGCPNITRTFAVKVIQNLLFHLARRQYVSPRFFFALASEKLQVMPDPVHAARLAAGGMPGEGRRKKEEFRRQTRWSVAQCSPTGTDG
jgi:hypothetical protein